MKLLVLPIGKFLQNRGFKVNLFAKLLKAQNFEESQNILNFRATFELVSLIYL